MKSICCVFAAFAFASCAQMGKIKTATVGGFAKVGSGVSSLTEKSMAAVMPARIPVVKVREKDLKPLPLGEERAMAFEKSRQRGGFFGLFSGPAHFEEPQLPANVGAMDGELLPPKME